MNRHVTLAAAARAGPGRATAAQPRNGRPEGRQARPARTHHVMTDPDTVTMTGRRQPAGQWEFRQ